MKTKSIAAELAERYLAPKSTEFSEETLNAAKYLLLDALGCAVAGQKAPGVSRIAEQLKGWGGTAQARLWSDGTALPSAHAALANSVAVHALDFDDIYMPGILHVSSVLVPAVVATAEETNASGREALAALILGTEVAGRIGIAFRPYRRGEGFLPTSIIVGFGAVLASCYLKRLPVETCVDAMGLLYAQLGGNRQALFEATLAKRMQPGFTARSALHSVEMAECGLNGAQHVFEGAAGLFALYGKGEQAPREDFFKERPAYEIERVAYKRYPSCGACHNVQIAAERLREKHHLQTDDIAEVQLFGCGPGGIVGHPFVLGKHPQASAQFSAAWAAAYALLRGPAALEAYTDEAVAQDQEVVELAQRITFVPKPENLPKAPELPEDYYPNAIRYDGLIVTAKDGQEYSEVQTPCHTFAPGVTDPDFMLAKFKDCLGFGASIDSVQAGELAQQVLCLEQTTDFRSFLNNFITKTAHPDNLAASV